MSSLLQSEAAQQQRLERDLRAVFEAGAGCMTLIVLTARSSRWLVVDAVSGDATAKLVLSATDRLLRQVHRRSRARALPCLLCDNCTLWRGEAPAAIGVLLPCGIDARTAIGLAFCEACAATRSERELGLAAVAKFRAEMMPDLRVLPTMAEAGHA